MTGASKNLRNRASKKAEQQNFTHQMSPGHLMKGLCGAKGTGVTLAPEIKGTKNACPDCLKVLARMEEKEMAAKAKGAIGIPTEVGLPLLGANPVPAEKLEPAGAPTKPAKAPKAPRAPKAAKKAKAGPTGGDKPKAVRTPKAPAEPKERDPRLPPAGTKLFKANRDGKKVECVVTDAGAIDYAGKLYKSLSGAARQASEDLGLGSKSQNGFLFWGVIRQARPIGDPGQALIKAYDRFDKVVDAVTASKPEGEAKAKLAESLRQFAAELSDAANAL